MKYSTAYLCAALSLTVVSLQAQTTSSQPAPAPATSTAPANTPQTTTPGKKPPVPVFKFQEVKTREYGTGYTVGVYGGANLFQFDDAELATPSLNTGMSLNSKVSGVGGIKFGYEFPATPIDIQSNDPTSFNFIPAIEAEAGYLGQDYNATLNSGAAGSTFKTKLDSAVFMLNGLAKFGMGLWRPYFGGGVGFAWVNSSDSSLNAPGVGIQDGNDNDVVLACQAIIGMEFFVSDTWSLFGEYKFFYMNDLNLKYTTTTAQSMNFEEGGIGSNIITMGVRTRF